MSINKHKAIIKACRPFILLMFIVIIIFVLKSCCFAKHTLKDYETELNENNQKIEYYINIQNQLHTTAQLLRDEDKQNTKLIQELSNKWFECNKEIDVIKQKNVKLEAKIEELKQPIFVGYFTITHYDICVNCTGKSPGDRGYGITATGTYATPGRTIAVDPKVIPYGSQVIINGRTYIAEDTGGAIRGNKIDICVSSDAEAFQKGRLYNVPVYIVRGE